MRKYAVMFGILAVIVLSLSFAQQAHSKEAMADGQLLGTWQITHRPVDAAGKPCQFLPETIVFLKDHSLIMSNVPGVHLPYKTVLTVEETQALEKRSESFKGKSLLLVKPTPRIDWRATPMVYIYTVTRNGLTLTVEGWETATFKRLK